jgi:hypothetical protein
MPKRKRTPSPPDSVTGPVAPGSPLYRLLQLAAERIVRSLPEHDPTMANTGGENSTPTDPAIADPLLRLIRHH